MKLNLTARHTRIFLSAAGALLLTAAASTLSGTWSGIQILEPSMLSAGPPDIPVVASDASGHAVAVWTSPSMGAVFSERYAGGSWSAGTTLPNAIEGFFPQVAIGSGGVVAATWCTPGSEFVPPKLMVSVRPAGGVFAAPIALVSGVNVYDAKLGVCASGSVTVVWSQAGRIRSAMRTPMGQWRIGIPLSPASVDAGLPDLAVNDAGAGVVAWLEVRHGSTGPAVIAAAYRPAPARSPFGVAQIVSLATGQQLWSPRALIDAAGNAAVGYVDGHTLMLAKKAFAGRWGLPQAFTPAGDLLYSSALSMDANGDVIGAWQTLDASNYGTVSMRILPAWGTLGAVQVLSDPTEDASYPAVAIASDGSIGSVTWTDNTTFAAHAALGGLSGAWTVDSIGMGWWNTQVPVAAGSGAVSAVWPAPTANPNVTRMVANVYTP